MDKLIEMAHVVRDIKVKTSHLLSTDRKRKNKPEIFFEKIINGDFRTDEDASRFFFNSGTSTSKYKNLKRYLRQKLLSTLYFIEPNKNYGAYNRTFLYCCKSMFAAKILINLGARHSGIDLCKKVFRRALEVELTEFVISSSRYLRLHYGARLGDQNKFAYYNKIFRESQEVMQAESLAEEYYVLLMIPYVKSKAADRKILELAQHYYQELLPYMDRYNSPFLHFYGHYIKVIGQMSANDYYAAARSCETAIAFFEKKSYTYITPLRVFYHSLLICHTQLKNFQEGKKAALKSMSYVLSGTHSWYINKELYLMLSLHSKLYDESAGILESALAHRKFNALSSTLKERWLIHSAYIHFLIQIGKAKPINSLKKRFNLPKFLNSIPVISKDKRGLNIPVLIIQILFMIVNKKYDESIDRLEAISKYCSRYLRKGSNYRSNCFIKMLLQIPACSFHRAAVERKTKTLRQRLQAAPPNITNQAHEIEIIPYEDLWDFILASLGPNFHRPRR